MKKLTIASTLVLLIVSSTPAALTVVDDVANDDYIVTAAGYWTMKIDKSCGSIWSFQDLTDNTIQNDTIASNAGMTTGEHYNYLGRSAYGHKGGLITFQVRGNDSMCVHTMGNMPNRFAFTYSEAEGWFKIEYTESLSDGYSEYACPTYNTYVENPGDVLTSTTVLIQEPTAAGTTIEWSQSMINSGQNTTNPPHFSIFASRSSANVNCTTTLYAGHSAAIDHALTVESGTEQNRSVTTTISDTTNNTELGLVAGREFVLTRDEVFDGTYYTCEVDSAGTWVTRQLDMGGVPGSTESNWAGMNYMSQGTPWDYSVPFPLDPDHAYTTSGTLEINIVPEPATMGLLVLGGLAMLKRRRQ